MTEELMITKHVFDDWWTGTYVDRLTPLLSQEVEALVDFHWKELQTAAIRHSLREIKEKMEEDCAPFTAMCDTHARGHAEEGCTCGPNNPPDWHFEDCPLYQEVQE